MSKLLEFGRKVIFYARVLSGYEERSIRNYRLQLEKRLQEAQERKAALRKIPEQTILAEVRRMVEEMQSLNQKLEDIEAGIEQYFKPIDKEAEALMKMQLEGEEKTMREMVKAMQAQALIEKAEVEKNTAPLTADTSGHNPDKKHAEGKEAKLEKSNQNGATLKDLEKNHIARQ